MSTIDPRADAPREPMVFAAEVHPLLIPAVERIVADLHRRNPGATAKQIGDQMFFEAILLLDSRIPRKNQHFQD